MEAFTTIFTWTRNVDSAWRKVERRRRLIQRRFANGNAGDGQREEGGHTVMDQCCDLVATVGAMGA